MTTPEIVWDWHPQYFAPPFTTLWGDGFDHHPATAEALPKKLTPVVSIMARAHDPGMHSDEPHLAGKWFMVTAYDVPKGQRQTIARSLKALCEMKWADYVNQQENQP